MKQKVCLITEVVVFRRKYCEYFSNKKFKVLCVDNNKNNLKIKLLKSKNIITYNCDISNYKEVEQLYKIISKSFFVDVLINNAAIDAIPFKKRGISQSFQQVKCGT